MNQHLSADQRHRDFLQKQHERQLAQSSISANAEAAELIADRIAARLAEQNDIIYKVGQRQGRTTVIAYISLMIGGAAALGQLLGPIWDWPVIQQILG
ncbi:MAG: hypothetical protein AAF346_13445 [Pseudomonadota bacterium]